jgi:hypothetical protein
LRNISVVFIAMAVAIGMLGLGVTEPAAAKIWKGCRTQQHQANQTGECNDIIIENLDRGPKGPFYHRGNSQKAKKHTRKAQ